MSKRLSMLTAFVLSLVLLSAPAFAAQNAPGGSGVGILGSYGESVISRVSRNWTLPAQAKNHTAVVNVKINPDGSVQQATIVRSSGRPYIDASLIQAVMASQLERPPAGISEMDTTFNTYIVNP